MADGTWSLAQAKAKLSEVVEKARTEGPQRLTRNGKDAVVVVSAEEWLRTTEAAGRRFVDALLDPAARVLSRREINGLFARDHDVGRKLKL